jgi:hypothetical protein
VYTLLLSIASKANCGCDRRQYNGVRAAKSCWDLLRAGYNSIHSKAQDFQEADVIINHFAELNF